MKKGTGVLIGIACFFAGVSLGVLLAPVKAGIGTNCGNNTHYHYNEKKEKIENNEDSMEEE